MNRDIESYLRENKPQVKDNPTFILEVKQKMRNVDGIKAEVDRQRRYGRTTILITLAIGLVLGASLIYIGYTGCISTELPENSMLANAISFLVTYKEYLFLPFAGCSIALALLLARKESLT